MTEKFVFNSSMPRSGSTLMQNILFQNPRFYCSPTSGLFELLLLARTGYSTVPEFKAQDPQLMRKAFMGLCRESVYGWYRPITDKPVVCDKCRGWFHYYEWVEQFMPNPKIIVCIRDLRAVLSSMEKLWRKNRHQQDGFDQQAKMNMITIDNRVRQWLNTPPVGLQMMRLRDAFQTGLNKHLHFVRYEDLTTKPKETMDKVYDFLEEEHFGHDFDNVEQKTQEDDAVFAFYGDHQIRQQVKPVKADWNEVLGRDISNHIREANAWFYQVFYPEVK